VSTAEYKQVTVLFADVVRSAAIAASVDIERLRDIMTETIERLVAAMSSGPSASRTPGTSRFTL
jgi:class 3 adenylate cyclase